MGDFNVSCGASGISMSYDRVALLPLVPMPYAAEEGNFQFNQAYLVSNEGASTLFEPFAFPIFGELNSYGMVGDIEDDFNTRAIERKYGCEIADFAEALCYGETIPTLPAHPCGMYIHRDVWEMMCQSGLDDFGKQKKDPRISGQRAVEDYTHALTREAKEEQLYKDHPELARNRKFEYNLRDDLSRYALSFGAMRDVDYFISLYHETLTDRQVEIADAIDKLWRFRWNMMACNRLLMPTYNGYQYGNHYQHKRLCLKTLEILRGKIREGEKDSA